MATATYLDSSAVVKLVVREPESSALLRYVRRRRTLVSSALARTEVLRALLPFADAALTRRGRDVLSRIDLIRVNDRALSAAAELLPAHIRSLDAIHLVTAQQLGRDLRDLVTYDERMTVAARELGLRVIAPS